ncbi:MAG: hypothetical protein Q8J98_12160 [Phaeovulum sp.]|uniref:hypothetical protein n=1 Tax=Phaeovulum sp. TaxID=2934796 RepID=UPI002730052A|nr:hypothetical protein [Phaeovulum sp.]MDP2063843.1 hypothetical protein [Phaeovulum sp.]
MRITIACPEALIVEANQLMRCIGSGVDDDRTFASAIWQSANGARFACAAQEADPLWLELAAGTLTEPAWGCDLAAAMAAQERLVFWSEPTPGGQVAVEPTAIWVLTGMAPAQALAAMGLAPLDLGD